MRFLALIAFCLLALLGLAAAKGPEEICACPRHLDTVCGSDGVTYPNPCELNCIAKRAARNGQVLTQVKAGRC
ncbi:serine protease inhibitor dipetalogastin [Drosophila hydei]|uniref:Serine protease inhibitor dipetalogastin n=1 Tax=Drosophila hydei TaxID=7224 RepID=A0A6J1MJS2_DROHY|nr:serine protease inhibitor dipetalogastin [Drosophila hydei]